MQGQTGDVIASEPPDRVAGDDDAPTGRDDPSLNLVYDMTKTQVDLQFKVTERLDAKTRTYAGFVVTVYAAVQAIVLKDDIHEKLGSTADVVGGLAIAATVGLVLCLGAAIHALRSLRESAVSEENLRDLARRAYQGDTQAGARGVNLLIGELHRRKVQNKARNERLKAVILLTFLTVAVTIAQLAFAVEAVT